MIKCELKESVNINKMLTKSPRNAKPNETDSL